MARRSWGPWGYPWISDRVNSTTILRAHGSPPFALLGALALMFAACGNESINVLTPRDAAADVDTTDASEDTLVDTSVDPSLDASVDASSDPPSTVDGPALDSPTLDGTLADGPIVDGPTAGCYGVGQSCSVAGQCCSLSCPLPSRPDDQRTCAAAPVCAPADQGCASNADCCSNLCDGNGCLAVTPPRCRPAGELCAANEDCCGARCGAGAGGLTRCALLDGCRVLGEVCVTNSECCSGRCDFDDSNKRRVCLAAPSSDGAKSE